MNNIARVVTFVMVLLGMLLGYYLGQRALVIRQRADKQAPGAAGETASPGAIRWLLPTESRQRASAIERGKKAFEKQQCFLCHVLPEMPEPPGTVTPVLGPDLADVGARLSFDELVESIANPNAKITAGDPLYTVDGKSRMPEIQGQIKVQELLELALFLTEQKKKPEPPAAP
ncbi:MAG: c-type cytochrome [Planctomycetota bacterium]|nr:c-type cytochrome [Planctomycetota bacterium]